MINPSDEMGFILKKRTLCTM